MFILLPSREAGYLLPCKVSQNLGFSGFRDTFGVFWLEKCPKTFGFRDFGILLVSFGSKSVPKPLVLMISGHYWCLSA